MYFDDHKLKVVGKFTYLGSITSSRFSMDNDITAWMKNDTGAFHALKGCVWSQRCWQSTTCAYLMLNMGNVLPHLKALGLSSAMFEKYPRHTLDDAYPWHRGFSQYNGYWGQHSLSPYVLGWSCCSSWWQISQANVVWWTVTRYLTTI